MPALFPMMAQPEDFRPGDCVRKFVTMSNVTPFCGIVTHLAPVANKVWVQWPVEHASESPETLIKVNPMIFGLPSVTKDHGYSSYEKELSEKLYGRIPKKATDLEKKAIRIAHTFATDVVGKLVDDIVECQKNNLGDVQAYNRIYDKYSDICSDYIIQSSIRKVYSQMHCQPERKQERNRCTSCGNVLEGPEKGQGVCLDCHLEGKHADKTAEDMKQKAMKFIMDAQILFDHVPEIRTDIEGIEKKVMKKFNITDKELTDFSIKKE